MAEHFLAIINVLERCAVTCKCGYHFTYTRHTSTLIAGNFPSVSSNLGNEWCSYHADCSPFSVITKIRTLLNDTTRILVGCFELQYQNQEHPVGSLCRKLWHWYLKFFHHTNLLHQLGLAGISCCRFLQGPFRLLLLTACSDRLWGPPQVRKCSL